jgi:hypothetical protein
LNPSRRRFVTLAAMAAGGLALPCCSGPGSNNMARDARYQEGGPASLPLFEVRGTSREIGQQIGRQFAGLIHAGLEERGEWWTDLLAFAKSQPPTVYDTFLAAAKTHTPEVLEELRGWSEGSGVPFRELMVLNLKAEYDALRDDVLACAPSGAGEEVPGCSTLVLADGDRLLVSHNEDGDMAYSDRMFMLLMHPEGRPSVLAASYPGILPGNAPWINSEGVMMTTNFIASREVKLGVGRYFLDRQAMTAATIEETVSICSHADRAYAFHHVIGSRTERRIIGLEVTASKLERYDGDGLYLHTNHLLLPTMAGEPQDTEYVESSSMSRWQVLNRWRDGLPDDARLDGAQLLQALSSHEQRPYSPCRHPEGEVRGATLLNALFDLEAGSVRIHKGQPCQGAYTDYDCPT